MRRILAVLLMLAMLMSSMPAAVSEEMEAVFEESLLSEASLEAAVEAEIPSAEAAPEAAVPAEPEIIPEITPEPMSGEEPAFENVPELMTEAAEASGEAAAIRVRIGEESRQGEEGLLVELRARVSEEGAWSYRWEYRDDAAWAAALAEDASADEAVFWQEIGGADEAVLDITARFGESYAAYSYRCLVTEGERETVSEAYRPEAQEESRAEVEPSEGSTGEMAIPEEEPEEAPGEIAEEIPAEATEENKEENTAEGTAENTADLAEESTEAPVEEQPADMPEELVDENERGEALAAPAALNSTAIKLGVGEKYTIFPDGAEDCSYASENAKIAAVSKDGVITAKKVGETKISISLGEHVQG